MKTRTSSAAGAPVRQREAAADKPGNLHAQSATAEVRPSANLTRFDAVSRIVDFIADLSLPQDRLTSEPDIAKLLGLSGRTPVIREALALLTRDGIVQPVPQRGYFVPRITVEQAQEILLLRLSILKAIVTRLAEADPSPRFHIAIELCSVLRGKETQSFLKQETAYWAELARQGGFIFAVQSLNSWGDHLRVFHADRQLSDDLINETAGHYQKVLENISERNTAGAVAAVQSNFQLRHDALNRTVQALHIPAEMTPAGQAS
jgi:DNA-binding GntR family transcriptional regulator